MSYLYLRYTPVGTLPAAVALEMQGICPITQQSSQDPALSQLELLMHCYKERQCDIDYKLQSELKSLVQNKIPLKVVYSGILRAHVFLLKSSRMKTIPPPRGMYAAIRHCSAVYVMTFLTTRHAYESW